MPTLAFWNTGGNTDASLISAFAKECEADILVLAENFILPLELLVELNSSGKRRYFMDSGSSNRLSIFTRYESGAKSLIRDSHGVAIRHYGMPLGSSLLLVAVHGASKLRKKTEDQILSSTRLARYVKLAEESVGHSRTVLIGDLNMNPFEAGVVGSEGLHAVMDRTIAAAGHRIVQEEKCPFFYNPMWSVLGDRRSAPPGTYFYNSGSEVNYYWNVFDQVLIRPSLLKYFSNDSVSIVTELRGASLLSGNGRPNASEYSDHLPIVCKLDEWEEA